MITSCRSWGAVRVLGSASGSASLDWWRLAVRCERYLPPDPERAYARAFTHEILPGARVAAGGVALLVSALTAVGVGHRAADQGGAHASDCQDFLPRVAKNRRDIWMLGWTRQVRPNRPDWECNSPRAYSPWGNALGRPAPTTVNISYPVWARRAGKR